VCNAVAKAPGIETCNGIDDNCDGQIDENLTNGSCSAGAGACAKIGQKVCSNGGWVCNAVAKSPTTEICNGIDDDCNGQVDEGLSGGWCSTGYGACAATGQMVCSGGAWTCNAVGQTPTAETCNGIDDNCDGQVDEGLSGAQCTAGTGACMGVGQMICSGGGWSCTAVPIQQPSQPQNGSIACSQIVGQYGVPANYTEGTAYYTLEGALCAPQPQGTLLWGDASDCHPCVSAPANDTVGCASIAGTFGLPKLWTEGTADVVIETATCGNNTNGVAPYGKILAADTSTCLPWYCGPFSGNSSFDLMPCY
jgi:hypothetical protein